MAAFECDHCSVRCSVDIATFVDDGQSTRGSVWQIWKFVCPECGMPNVIVTDGSGIPRGAGTEYRLTTDFSGMSNAVPADLLEAFREAREVLRISPRASAVLSRLILQHLLAIHGFKGGTLFHHIRELRESNDPRDNLPQSLSEALDGIRGFGNLGAHPNADSESGRLILVEEGEAEWCLHVLERLIEHYYVNPARDKQVLEALELKRKRSR